jgi:hypothetical protein
VPPWPAGGTPAILHEPTEALRINRYIDLNPVRIAALGGHEIRDVSAPEMATNLTRQRLDALEQYRWSSFAFFAGTKPAPTWLCTETILAFFGEGTQRKLQQRFRQQLQEAAAAGNWEGDWKSEVKYTVFLGSSEFVAQMRKFLRGDRDQQTGVRRGAVEALAWPKSCKLSVLLGVGQGKNFYPLGAAGFAKRRFSLVGPREG